MACWVCSKTKQLCIDKYWLRHTIQKFYCLYTCESPVVHSHYLFFYLNAHRQSETIGSIWCDTLKWENKKRLTYLKYGPCRPETSSAFSGKNPNRKRHSFDVPSWFRCVNHFNNLSTKISFKRVQFQFVSKREKKGCSNAPAMFFIFGLSTPTIHAPFHTSESKGRCWTERTKCHCALGVQLLPLINWMLRFHVGNPREGHHLQLKGVQWRHQCLQHTSTPLKSAQYVCQSARSCSPTFDITVKNLSYPETALKCHNRQHFIQISST